MEPSSGEQYRVEVGAGAEIAVAVNGDPAGRPVLLLPAAPGSRVLDPDPRVTRDAGVRLLSVDRPGYGESTAWPEGVAPSWAALAERLLRVVEEFAPGGPVRVVGWSNGGIGALALAVHAPALVERVALVGTPAPDDAVPWVPPEFREALVALRQDPGSAVAALQAEMEPMAADPVAAVGGVAGGPADERVLAGDGDAHDRLVAMMREALRQGAAGVAADIVATNVVPWGFALEDVACPVDLWYGADDLLIPPAHGDYYAAELPRAAQHTVEGAGHLLLMTQWSEILASLRRDG